MKSAGGEIGEGGVRGEDQEQGGGELHQVVVGADPHQGAGELAVHRLRLGRVGDDADLAGQEADADETVTKQVAMISRTMRALRASGA